MFPGSGYLEIACVAGAIASGRKVRKLRDIVWIQPLVFEQPSQLIQIALQPMQDQVAYMVTSFAGQDKVVHAEGILCLENELAEYGAVQQHLAPADLQACSTRQLDAAHYYALFRQAGICYGPAFQTMQSLWVGEGYALSRLAIAAHLRAGFEQFVLHPSLIDGALQTVAALVGNGEAATPFLPFAIDEVDIIRPLSPVCYVHAEHAGAAPGAQNDVMKFNIKIVNEAGLVLVNIRHFCVRAFGQNDNAGSGVSAVAND
jgi:polyketide synthase PksL